MAILLEGYSLVFRIDAIEQKYPGGTHGLVYDWNNGSWCSDGSLGRISYYAKDDAFCCLLALADRGLNIASTHAEDVALILHGGHPWAPCLWAEVETTPSGFVYCAHISDKPERIFFPGYFRRDWSLAHYAIQDEAVLARDVAPVIRSARGATYRDARLDKTFRGPGFLSRH
ncbi:MAG: hypothetical protein CVU34_11885 [Betaproteobacteria bacterium HGW-Betaproteobacteria-7]|jgi:hypothetical protein|nr:MAG: hypothetical protein CVU34_11885 [Betaproteobacteria bacterium HGW-Betaproteobacteria-7]